MARVIRGSGSHVVPAIVGDARDEAARIVAEAEREAAEMRERLRAELSAEAREAARAELASAHVEVERARREVLREAESSIAALALAVARRLVGEELETRPEHIRNVVGEAMERVRRAARVRVRVHPNDAAQLVHLDVGVVEDAAITRGGCIVESDLGEVDARLEVRLDALARVLAKP